MIMSEDQFLEGRIIRNWPIIMDEGRDLRGLRFEKIAFQCIGRNVLVM